MRDCRVGGQLIANMVNSSQFEDRWREAAVLDDADLIRKAETVLQMILAKRASTRSQIVRDALYTDRGGNDRPITPPAVSQMRSHGSSSCSNRWARP